MVPTDIPCLWYIAHDCRQPVCDGRAILLGVPTVLTSVFLAKVCPAKFTVSSPGVDLLAGIPSVVYGFFGMVAIVPLYRQQHPFRLRFAGDNDFAYSYRALALWACPNSTMRGAGARAGITAACFVVLPLPSRVFCAVVLASAKAGETMAVIMVAGNQARCQILLEGVRTLTGNIVIEMGYAADLHRKP